MSAARLAELEQRQLVGRLGAALRAVAEDERQPEAARQVADALRAHLEAHDWPPGSLVLVGPGEGERGEGVQRLACAERLGGVTREWDLLWRVREGVPRC
jgi:GGDEF domain-containing protein